MNKEDIFYICNSYKLAADKNGIIPILSQQFCCEEQDMVDLLEVEGFNISAIKLKKPQKKKKSFVVSWNNSEVEIMIDCIKNNHSCEHMKKVLEEKGFERTLKQIYCKKQTLTKTFPELLDKSIKVREWTEEENEYLLENMNNNDMNISRGLFKKLGSKRGYTEIRLQIERLRNAT